MEVTGANGTLFMPGGRRFEIRNARGRIAGIESSSTPASSAINNKGKPRPTPAQLQQRRELLSRVISELKNWHFNAEHPPELRVFIEGDANERTSLTAKLALHAHDVEKNQHVLDEVGAEAEITGDLLTVTSLHATDSRGSLDGHLDYDTRRPRRPLRCALVT